MGEVGAPDPGTVRQDAVTRVPGAIASVPDGLTSAMVVGVNPVYGLYASIAGPIDGGCAVSPRRMLVATTTAVALAAGSTLGATAFIVLADYGERLHAPVGTCSRFEARGIVRLGSCAIACQRLRAAPLILIG